MKKFLFILLIIPFILTGCKDKEFDYKCSLKNEEDKSFEEISGHFKNNKLQSSIILITLDLSDYLQYESIDTYYDKFVESYKDYVDQEGVDLEIEKGDTFLKVKLNVDFNSISEDVMKRLEINQENKTISSSTFIKHYTDKGYTCE